jgi:hypothetical protein
MEEENFLFPLVKTGVVRILLITGKKFPYGIFGNGGYN